MKVIRFLSNTEASTTKIAVPVGNKKSKAVANTVHRTIQRKIERAIRTPGKIVGHKYNGDTNQIFQRVIEDDVYPISNNIGVGILSYNRLGSIQRLIASIRKHTNLTSTTVFVSDESSIPEVRNWLSQQPDIICVFGDSRLGVAGNTNRLLKCLSRFKYKLLLNDDVEIMSNGWDSFYFKAMERTKLHHFCFKQVGIYGATTSGETRKDYDGTIIKTIHEKPQGAIMALDHFAFETAGYFDEKFGIYGFEHVDWSRRVALSGIQKSGYHDVVGSEKYFRIWNEESAVENRIGNFNKNRATFNTLSTEEHRIYINATEATNVPSVSVIVPCRDTGSRTSSIPTIINNIRAQRFPNIDIIVAEQDDTRRINEESIFPCRHILVKSSGQPFCKSAAFNVGVAKAKFENLVLHDADITVPGWYINKVNKILSDHEACHIGQQVLYLTAPSTLEVNKQKSITKDKKCDHIVDYFEGGSLGIRRGSYVKIGGFDEKFVGYGVEDCEFFQRMCKQTKFYDTRSVKMVHLWHDRTPGWEDRHKINKAYLIEMQNRYTLPERCDQLRELLTRRYSFK